MRRRRVTLTGPNRVVSICARNSSLDGSRQGRPGQPCPSAKAFAAASPRAGAGAVEAAGGTPWLVAVQLASRCRASWVGELALRCR